MSSSSSSSFKFSFVVFFLCLFAIFFVASPVSADYASVWTDILSKVVTETTMDNITVSAVNYTRLLDDGSLQSSFQTVLKDIANMDPSSVNTSRTEFYSFYLNAYNVLAVQTVLTHPCESDVFGECGGTLSSIRDVGTVPFTSVWTREAGTVAGKNVSLEELEDLIRAGEGSPFDCDARTHAALNCASISCPDLLNEAYSPANLDVQLNQQMGKFLSNPKKGLSLDMEENTVHLSYIFYWYSDDFEDNAGTVLDFISHGNWTALDANVRSYLRANRNSTTIEYLDYKWGLNGDFSNATNPPCSKRLCYPAWALMLTVAIILLLLIATIAVVALLTFRRRTRDTYQRV